MRATASERHHRDVRSVGSRRKLNAAVAVLVLGLSAFTSTVNAAGADDAKKIFNQRCTACHTFGRGVKVGPDLKGVTERRQRAWLLAFIRSSQSVIDSGDAVAAGLFEQFKRQRMPDWTDLSEEQIGAIIDWLAANGPEQRPVDERLAELATPADIERGRDLFHGAISMAGGAMACASCHAVRENGETVGGTFGPDLTSAYTAYRDRAMTLFFRQPCFRRLPESSSSAPTGFLLPHESFALKAYLRQIALPDASTAGSRGTGAAIGDAPWTAGISYARMPGAAGSALRNEILFTIFPYAALLILAAGLALRHALGRRRVEAVRAEARTAWRLFSGSTAWRVGLAATAAAHLAGLLLPDAIWTWNGEPLRLYLLEGAGFIFGLLVLFGWARVMWRHFGRTGESRAARGFEIADCIFLSLLFVAIASGLLTAALHRWGSSWSGGTLGPYLASLVDGAPVTAFVTQMPFLVKVHVLSLFALIAVLPFTSAALVAVAAMDRVLSLAARPLGAGARAAKRRLARFNPGRWIWPEEDLVEMGDGDTEKPQAPT